MAPSVGDRITGTVKGYLGTVIGAESYRLDDVEVVEPVMLKDDYPLGTVVESQGRDFVKMTRPDCRVRWYQTGSEDGLSGHHLDWRSIARDHVVKYRPDQGALFVNCTFTDTYKNHMAVHWHNKYDNLKVHVETLQQQLGASKKQVKEMEERFRSPATPRTVTTEAEYEALPEGSIVLRDKRHAGYAYTKQRDDEWQFSDSLGTILGSADMAGVTRAVLREGWTA